jgi:LacI family transcriptional regulator
MSAEKEIALAFPRGAHQEVFLEGVLCYAEERQLPWTYVMAAESLAMSVLDLKSWSGDGILAALNTEQEAELAQSLSMPIINISSALEKSPVPRSMVDNTAIGVLAAEHLKTKGFQTYAFYGLTGVSYSTQRFMSYRQCLLEAGFDCTLFLAEPTYGLPGIDWQRQHHDLLEWIRGLPTPCGIFAVSDYRAIQVLNACRRLGIHVPGRMAVLGVDNEQVICEHSHPRLSSVSRNDGMEGYRAAELLDCLMKGLEVPNESVTAPLQVVERQSTATFAVTDPRLQAALTYLHDHLEDPISIDQVISHAQVSRRWLEYTFRDVLGETPYQYLRRQRLAHAKRLLATEPATKIYGIAQRSGFSSAKQLTIAFQQEFGQSPREYRRNVVNL